MQCKVTWPRMMRPVSSSAHWLGDSLWLAYWSGVEAGDGTAVAAYWAFVVEVGEAMVRQLFGCDGVREGKLCTAARTAGQASSGTPRAR